MTTRFQFNESGNNLSLIVAGRRNGTPYNMAINSLDAMRDGESEWVMHLLEDKDWIEKEMLYELAQRIIKHHPDNKINWVNTFTTVEAKFLHDEGNRNLGKADSVVGNLIQEIEANRDRVSTPEYQEELKKRVEDNLKRYKIPTGQQ